MFETSKGFTLIETLVAVSILLVSIGGPLTIAQRGISSATLARDQITAFYLAQEAIEYVRNVRDSNSLLNANGTPTNWLSGLTDCLDGKVCTVDTKADDEEAIAECSGGVCGPLLYDGEFYTYTAGTASRFTRSVAITTINDHEVDVEVTINWTAQNLPRSFVISEHIFDW